MAGIGSAPGIILGVGVGAATSAALAPAIEVPKQDAWASAPNRILDPVTLARLVAQGGISLGDAQADGRRDGYAGDKIAALTYLAQTVPGIGEATDLWRKGLLSDALYTHSLNKSGLDERYVAPIVAAKTAEILGIGDIAFAIVRGILPSPSWVPVPPPTGGTSVPRFPQVEIDPIALARRLGYSEDMLQIAVGRSGLSLAPGLAANAYFRDLINANDFTLAIAEGDLRTEWAHTLREVSRQIPTAHDFVEGYLRGWISQGEMHDGAGLHGMTADHSDLLYAITGRPSSVRHVYMGLARGAKWPATYDDVPQPYQDAIRRSAIRPEYADIEYQNRYSLPSAFVVRQLLRDGAISADRGQAILEHSGWPPDLAQLVAQAYSGGGGTSADPHVAKAQTQLWTQTHRSYVSEEVDAATATGALTAAGVTAAAAPQIITLWNHERDLIRKQLTAAQVKKAVQTGAINPATGVAWTLDDGIARLLDMGYNANDAHTFLQL